MNGEWSLLLVPISLFVPDPLVSQSISDSLADYELFVRYKVSSQQGGNEWHRSAADEDSLGAKIPVGRILNNGDEMTVQVSGMEGTKCQLAPKFEFKTKCQKEK